MKFKFYVKRSNGQEFWLRWGNDGDLRLHDPDRLSDIKTEIRHRYGHDSEIKVFVAGTQSN